MSCLVYTSHKPFLEGKSCHSHKPIVKYKSCLSCPTITSQPILKLESLLRHTFNQKKHFTETMQNKSVKSKQSCINVSFITNIFFPTCFAPRIVTLCNIMDSYRTLSIT